jgi:hypothetical protein
VGDQKQDDDDSGNAKHPQDQSLTHHALLHSAQCRELNGKSSISFRIRYAGNDRSGCPFSGPHQEKRIMTDKKKGDFDQWQRKDEGGDKKQRADRNEDSRTGNQNSGSGGRP